MVGVAFFAFLVGLIAGKVGRRPLLVLFSIFSALGGLGLFFVDHYLTLLVIAFLGSLSTGGGGVGESPAQPLEVASLPDTAPDDKRTDLFTIYNIIARTSGALGALAAGLPAVYQGAFGLTTLEAYGFMFVAFAALQIIGALLYSLLSAAVEGESPERRWSNPSQASFSKAHFHTGRSVQRGYLHHLDGDPKLDRLLVLHQVRIAAGILGLGFLCIPSAYCHIPLAGRQNRQQNWPA